MSNPDKVLAICVNWNGRGVLRETVNSLLGSNYAGLDVLVVDNASTDDSITSLPGKVGVVRLETNLGYGGAINAVVRPLLETESASHFLLLNNDVILAEGAVSALIEYAKDKEPGVFGPRIVRFDAPGRLEAAWGKVSWSHVLARYYGKNANKNRSQWERFRQVELLLGSVLLVHRQIFEKVGLFDENFFMYHEEVDFLFRTRRSGFPVYYCPKAEVIHHGAHSTRQQPLKKVYWIRRNAIHFLRKHQANGLQWTYFWTTLVLSLLFNALALRWSRLATIFRAVKEGLAERC
jgi:GT2 family glycosyltransferase